MKASPMRSRENSKIRYGRSRRMSMSKYARTSTFRKTSVVPMASAMKPVYRRACIVPEYRRRTTLFSSTPTAGSLVRWCRKEASSSPEAPCFQSRQRDQSPYPITPRATAVTAQMASCVQGGRNARFRRHGASPVGSHEGSGISPRLPPVDSGRRHRSPRRPPPYLIPRGMPDGDELLSVRGDGRAVPPAVKGNGPPTRSVKQLSDLVRRMEPEGGLRLCPETQVLPRPLVHLPFEVQDPGHGIASPEFVLLDVPEHVECEGSRPRREEIPIQELDHERATSLRMPVESAQTPRVDSGVVLIDCVVETQDRVEAPGLRRGRGGGPRGGGGRPARPRP